MEIVCLAEAGFRGNVWLKGIARTPEVHWEIEGCLMAFKW